MSNPATSAPARAPARGEEPAPPRGRRAQRKDRTRHALFGAAMTLFAQQGYDAVTVDDIAARSGVSRRTFFRYYATKDAVLLGHHDRRLAVLRRHLRRSSAETPGHQLVRRALQALVHRATLERDELLAVERVVRASGPLIARQLEQDIELELLLADEIHRADAGGAAGRLRAEVCAAAVVGAWRSTLRAWFGGGCADDLRVMAELALDIVIRGVAARELVLEAPADEGLELDAVDQALLDDDDGEADLEDVPAGPTG